MGNPFVLIGAAVLLVGQIVCMFSKKIWVRLLPLMVIGALAAFCFAMYALSGFTNWGYVVLLMLLGSVVAVIGVIWFCYGFSCLVQKAEEYTGL